MCFRVEAAINTLIVDYGLIVNLGLAPLVRLPDLEYSPHYRTFRVTTPNLDMTDSNILPEHENPHECFLPPAYWGPKEHNK